MPDHAHVLFRIIDGSTLGEILHSTKSFSANRINQLLGRQGAFWLDENFDHIIRNEAAWEEKCEYIRQNPVKKGLIGASEDYQWLHLKGYRQGHRQDACATSLEFEIFEPKHESDVPPGTVTRAKATCLCCGTVLPPERVRAQLAAQRGGADVLFDDRGRRTGGARLLAVVTLQHEERGRSYRVPTDADYRAVYQAHRALEERASQPLPHGLSAVPDEPLPPIGTLGFRVQRYGMLQWGDLFTVRQKLAMAALTQHVATLGHALPKILTLALGRTADQMSHLVSWLQTIEAVSHTFVRQALPIVWDFVEICPLGDESANFGASIGWVAKVVTLYPRKDSSGQVAQRDACEPLLRAGSAQIWFTDPPYYDAVPYSDLSDFFFVWFKRALGIGFFLRDPSDARNPLSPKIPEIVQDETKQFDGKPKDRSFFEGRMSLAFAEGRRVLTEDGVGSVVFAHKTTEGWEALLSGMIRGGWTVTGSWPIATERSVRLRARESAALATSVHLVCRPQAERAGVGDWAEVLRELPGRVGEWMERLQAEGVRGADLVFACIGPALEIFSRCSKVETAEGREVQLPEFLEKVWEVVGRIALEQVLGTADGKAGEGAAGALEEDARLTALFLWTLQSTDTEQAGEIGTDPDDDEAEGDGEKEEGGGGRKKGLSLIFDVVRRFAQPLGIHLPEWEERIIETHKGVVRLLPVAERAEQLFGEEGAQAVAERLESSPAGAAQLTLFAAGPAGESPQVKGRGRGRGKKGAAEVSDAALQARREATTLDRVHAAMLLQAGGRANALRALLAAEQQRGPDFLRLANALSALYPKASEEKRLLDAMLLAVPR
jgi:hypothetical protein